MERATNVECVDPRDGTPVQGAAFKQKDHHVDACHAGHFEANLLEEFHETSAGPDLTDLGIETCSLSFNQVGHDSGGGRERSRMGKGIVLHDSGRSTGRSKSGDSSGSDDSGSDDSGYCTTDRGGSDAGR